MEFLINMELNKDGSGKIHRGTTRVDDEKAEAAGPYALDIIGGLPQFSVLQFPDKCPTCNEHLMFVDLGVTVDFGGPGPRCTINWERVIILCPHCHDDISEAVFFNINWIGRIEISQAYLLTRQDGETH